MKLISIFCFINFRGAITLNRGLVHLKWYWQNKRIPKDTKRGWGKERLPSYAQRMEFGKGHTVARLEINWSLISSINDSGVQFSFLFVSQWEEKGQRLHWASELKLRAVDLKSSRGKVRNLERFFDPSSKGHVTLNSSFNPLDLRVFWSDFGQFLSPTPPPICEMTALNPFLKGISDLTCWWTSSCNP